jgi:hypothetical protein
MCGFARTFDYAMGNEPCAVRENRNFPLPEIASYSASDYQNVTRPDSRQHTPTSNVQNQHA